MPAGAGMPVSSVCEGEADPLGTEVLVARAGKGVIVGPAFDPLAAVLFG